MESNPTKRSAERSDPPKNRKTDKKRLRELETENARLRREVARLRVRLDKSPPVVEPERNDEPERSEPPPNKKGGVSPPPAQNPNICTCGAELITAPLGPKTLKRCKVCGYWGVA